MNGDQDETGVHRTVLHLGFRRGITYGKSRNGVWTMNEHTIQFGVLTYRNKGGGTHVLILGRHAFGLVWLYQEGASA